MSQEAQEGRKFQFIGRNLTNPDLSNAVLGATENSYNIDLHQELKTLSKCIQKANSLIQSRNMVGLNGIQHSRRILKQHGLVGIPSSFIETEKSQSWLNSLGETIKVGNREIKPKGKVYKDPKEIQNGDPLNIFRWYLYDGYGRMVAIHLGISNKNNHKQQEHKGDWLACALTEAAVVLAEEGDEDAKEVVNNMLDMEFIAGGWILSDKIVGRAKALFETSAK